VINLLNHVKMCSKAAKIIERVCFQWEPPEDSFWNDDTFLMVFIRMIGKMVIN